MAERTRPQKAGPEHRADGADAKVPPAGPSETLTCTTFWAERTTWMERRWALHPGQGDGAQGEGRPELRSQPGLAGLTQSPHNQRAAEVWPDRTPADGPAGREAPTDPQKPQGPRAARAFPETPNLSRARRAVHREDWSQNDSGGRGSRPR